MALNRVMLIGNIGKKPELREMNGFKVLNLTVATTDKGYIKKDGTQVPDRTEWHDCVAWNNTAEVLAKYVDKGDKIFISGKLRHRKSENNGTTRYYTDVEIEEFEFLPKNDGSQASQDKPAPQAPEPQPVPTQPQDLFGGGDDDDELPF